MENSLVESILNVCKILNTHSVEYLIVGGTAVDLGQDVTLFRAETAPNPKRSFFRLEFDKFTIDFLPELPGLSKFRPSFKAKDVSMIDEIEIPYINCKDLILNKQTQARPKDIEDIEQLRKLNPE